MSIPYKRKYLNIKNLIDLSGKSFIVGVIIGMWIGIFTWDVELISPVEANAPPVVMDNSFHLKRDTAGERPTFAEFKDYARQIFGKDWKVAVAVSECECNHTRKEWPYCINSWGTNNNTGEHSVGAWQINLARNGGKGAWVHADKIPGNTIGEKEIWLMDWRQNTMMARIISQNGWQPWSGFSSQCYLAKMKGL